MELKYKIVYQPNTEAISQGQNHPNKENFVPNFFIWVILFSWNNLIVILLLYQADK
jgi:hypothetical protein